MATSLLNTIITRLSNASEKELLGVLVYIGREFDINDGILKFTKHATFETLTTPINKLISGHDDIVAIDYTEISDVLKGRSYSLANHFEQCGSLKHIYFGENFGTSMVTDMSSMFFDCYSLEELDLSSFDTSNVTDMHDMYLSCGSLKSIKFGEKFDTSHVTDMSSMFYGCEELTTIDLSLFSTYNVKDMNSMFRDCVKLASLDLSSFDTSNVTDMKNMFAGCCSLRSVNLSSFDTSNVTDMDYMFDFCLSIESLDLSIFDTTNVITMQCMFGRCEKLQTLNIASFNACNIKRSLWYLEGCSMLKHIWAKPEVISALKYEIPEECMVHEQ